MAVNGTRNNLAYGFNNALQVLNPLPIIAGRAPQSTDSAEFGQQWIYSNQIWEYTSAGTWTQLATQSASNTFSSLTVNGATALNGTVAVVTGNLTFSVATGTGPINIGTDAATKAITIGNTTGTTAIAINSSSSGIVLNSNSLGKINIVSNKTSQSATFTAVNNAYVGTAVLTGNTIAQSATQVVTLSNSNITATNGVQYSINANNVSGGGALLTVKGAIQGAGSLAITVTNNGGAGGLGATDSIVISYIVLG